MVDRDAPHEPDRLSQHFWFWGRFFAVHALWALAQTAVASAFGARPVSLGLGDGPLLSARLESILWAFRPVMLGSAVSFDEPGESASAPARAPPARRRYPPALNSLGVQPTSSPGVPRRARMRSLPEFSAAFRHYCRRGQKPSDSRFPLLACPCTP